MFRFDFDSHDIRTETVPCLIDYHDGFDVYQCRHCDAWIDWTLDNYCPNCGQAFAPGDYWWPHCNAIDLDVIAGCIDAGQISNGIGVHDRRADAKMIPRRPKIYKAISKGHKDFLTCPSCGRGLSNPMTEPYNDHFHKIYTRVPIHFCPKCGQALDDNEGKTWKEERGKKNDQRRSPGDCPNGNEGLDRREGTCDPEDALRGQQELPDRTNV